MSTAADEIWAILREVAEAQKETGRRFKETDRKFQETDRQIKETDRQLKETDRKVKEVTASVGRLSNRLGDFIEEAAKPAAVRLFRERGIEVHEVHCSVVSKRGNEGLEVDVMVVNDTDLVAVECKSKLSLDDVREHVERLAKLKRLIPAYADKRVMGALAAMVIPDNVAEFAFRQGLFVIGQSGDHLEIRNGAEFEAAVW